MIVYLYTSALVKLYAEEENRELVFEAVDSSEAVATSTVAYAETRAALARRLREGKTGEERHHRTVERLDREWRTYERLAVSDLVAYRAGERPCGTPLEASTQSTSRAPYGSRSVSRTRAFWPSTDGSPAPPGRRL